MKEREEEEEWIWEVDSNKKLTSFMVFKVFFTAPNLIGQHRATKE